VLSLCGTPKIYFDTKILRIKKVQTPTPYNFIWSWNVYRVGVSDFGKLRVQYNSEFHIIGSFRVRVPTPYDMESELEK